MNHAADNTRTNKQPTENMQAADRARVAATLNKLQPAKNTSYESSDIGDGRLFADVFKDRARFVPERKSWFVYDGRVWSNDVSGLGVMALCKTLAKELLTYTATIEDDKVRGIYLKHAQRWQRRQTREIILRDARDVYPVSAKEFDVDPFLINCKNGTVNVKTGIFSPHRSEDLLTKLAPVNYDPSARCERFDRFISEITSGDRDKAIFLQKCFGYGATGDTSRECMFILYGATSRNGKGTLCETVLNILGSYSCASNPETIAQKTGRDSSRPSEDIARLFGIRFANISEPPKGMTLDAAKVKTMTGRDTLNARFLNENSFDFKPYFKLFINTNHSLLVDDASLFASDRVILIPFDRHFSESERDTGLKDEFAKPQNQSAILNWLIAGYQMLCVDGFRQPEAVRDAIEEYRFESDKIAQFVKESMTPDADGEIRTTDVYHAYQIWCSANDCPRESPKSFNTLIRSHATIVRRRPRSGGEKTTLLVGFRLK